MTALPVTLTLALIGAPEPPSGAPADGWIAIDVVLDAAGRLDAQAWARRAERWAARRSSEASTPESGDLSFDEDNGWSLRFYGAAADRPDAPPVLLDPGPDPLRPGAHVTLREADVDEATYRVVGLEARSAPLAG